MGISWASRNRVPSHAAWAPSAKYGGHSSSVPDPAGGDHWHRRHRVHHGGHQGKRRHLTPYVPASLPALRHDDINSAVDRSPRFFCAADGVQNDSVGIVDLFDVAGGISEEQRHDTHSGFKGLVKATMLVGVENQIASEGTIGKRRRLTNHVSGRIRPRQRQHSERAGIRDRCRQFGHRRHRRLDDRVFDPEQLTHRRSHDYHLSIRSGLQRLQPASTWTRLASSRQTLL